MNFENYAFAHGRQDIYIEVGNEDLARQIELLEETTVKLSLQITRLIDIID